LAELDCAEALRDKVGVALPVMKRWQSSINLTVDNEKPLGTAGASILESVKRHGSDMGVRKGTV
jgi:hypothetical protein